MYFEYIDKERNIKRILRETNRHLDNDQYEMLSIILAMGIFSKHILSPIADASNFTKYLQDNDVTALKIRDYILDNKEYIKIRKAVAHFGHIMKKYKIEDENLDLSDLRKFIRLNFVWMSE